MTTLELTEEMIAEAMARAEKVACAPGDQRCYPLPYSAVEARKTCTPKGRCKVGGHLATTCLTHVCSESWQGEASPAACHVMVRGAGRGGRPRGAMSGEDAHLP
jgi:hypothetical protein